MLRHWLFIVIIACCQLPDSLASEGEASSVQSKKQTYTPGLYPELGGYVFFVDTCGTKGLVASLQDQGDFQNWFQANELVSDPRYFDALAQGFSDWRLPLRQEITLMYQHKDKIGGFTNDFYWTRSQLLIDIESFGWVQSFGNALFFSLSKHHPFRTRAVRSF